MEFQKAVIIGVHQKDQFQNPPQHLIADVVLLEKDDPILQPKAYQLKDQVLPHHESTNYEGVFHLPQGAFLMVGEVVSIDKKKKVIYLNNGNSVSYNHLIIASSSKVNLGQQNKWSVGVKALIDALKLQKKMPTILSMPYNLYYQNVDAKLPNYSCLELSQANLQSTLPRSIDKIAHHYIPQDQNASNSQIIEAEKRLFEVQL